MADTVAVMNAGRIEQMGAPTELYESPRTTFAANFLGQSNLVEGTSMGADGSDLVVDCHGQKVAIPADRCVVSQDRLLLGVRPEKVRLHAAADEVPAGENAFTGGRVVDASFTGVSTQYLVRMPWGQELTVFAQNLGVGERFPAGSEVTLSWERGHSFGLAGDARAGSEVDDEPAVPVAVS